MAEDMLYMESIPDDVQATIEARNRAFAALGNSVGGLEAVIDELRRWLPGQTVRVAFLGGSPKLHRDIAEVAQVINDYCSLTLDFEDGGTGSIRTWSTQDTEYTAEIRVSFDHQGFFSLVGTDSIAPNIGSPNGPVGGRPNQRSLNLGGFDIQRPAGWRGTVLHEFLHACAFHHEHVSTRGPCQDDFRFEDDPGYLPTQDARGVFITDSSGRRPGIYSFLSGAPNFWPRAKVDHNLKPSTDPVVTTSFDRSSVMLYRFPSLFYRTSQSGCTPDGDGQNLSAGDREGLALIYPPDDDEMTTQVVERKKETAKAIAAVLDSGAPSMDIALETAADTAASGGESILQGSLVALQRQISSGVRG